MQLFRHHAFRNLILGNTRPFLPVRVSVKKQDEQGHLGVNKQVLVEAFCQLSTSIHKHLSIDLQVRFCCYRSAQCHVNSPCRAEVINPSHIAQRDQRNPFSLHSFMGTPLVLRLSMKSASCSLPTFCRCSVLGHPKGHPLLPPALQRGIKTTTCPGFPSR